MNLGCKMAKRERGWENQQAIRKSLALKEYLSEFVRVQLKWGIVIGKGKE